MDFLFVNSEELTALTGLPYIQQVAYLLGIRPYMDRNTLIVGIKRRISYQSLAEMLYVEPHQGLVNSGSPSKQQLRRVLKSLEKAGLIEIQSSDFHLILKCRLANAGNSFPNKPNTNPARQAGTNSSKINNELSSNYENEKPKLDSQENPKPDIPHNSERINTCLGQMFETFWALYPKQVDKPRAWKAFSGLNPDQALFSTLVESLKKQIRHHQNLINQGIWMPDWKYPANWLAQESWKQVITTQTAKELKNEASKPNNPRKNNFDVFWNSCSQGAGLSFDDL